ncbi:MAG: hypothetical protein IPP44_00225 [Ideonella sp.]|nr:hypothetical protein [Ideonella sp.]
MLPFMHGRALISLECAGANEPVPIGELLWALGSVCAMHRLPFDAALTAREYLRPRPTPP